MTEIKLFKDIMQLRNNYRMVGKFIGSHPKMTRQNNVMSRPMLLNSYEITLLCEKGFATLCKKVDVDDEVLLQRQHAHQEQHNTSLAEQRKLAYKQKIYEIESRSDEIVAGIAKKQNQTEPRMFSEKSVILKTIMEQIQPIQEQNMVVQQPIEEPWSYTTEEVPWTFPNTDLEHVKYLTFKDLWQQQFILTCGAKFGGDFLVYSGDPELYHAKYIAVCQQSTDSMHPTDVVQIARLASNVKKTALLCKADLATGQVMYSKLNYSPLTSIGD